MKITRDEILHVARLARLDLDEEDVARFTRQVSDILEYVETLSEVDTTDVPPMSHAIDVHNAFREDVVLPSMGAQAALANAPEKEGSEILVPKVI